MPITLVTPTAGPAFPHTIDPASRSAGSPAHTPVPPLVIAHRGASEEWPENTIPAFMAGIDQGADMIETDVHMSADGELVIMHDTTVDRTTDARCLLPDHADRSIAEAINASLRALPDSLERALAAGMLVVQSADWAFVREFHALAPEVPVGVLGRPCPDELQDFAEWVDQINPECIAADAEFLRRVHGLGMSSLVWTVDEVVDMHRAIEAGADGIITNVPDRLVDVIEDL